MLLKSLTNLSLTFDDLLVKTKVELRSEQPYFSYILAHFLIIVTDSVKTAAVDGLNRIYVNADWVMSLSEDNRIKTNYLKFILCHEIFHPLLRHMDRAKMFIDKVTGENGAGAGLFNIATDTVINNILKMNGFTLMEGVIIPDNDSVTLFGGLITVDQISHKCAEEIYSEIKKKLPKGGGGKGKDGEDGFSVPTNDIPEIDNHDKWEEGKEEGKEAPSDKEGDKDGKGIPKDVPEGKKVDWDKVQAEASVFAKQQGHSPAGIEREFEMLHTAKIRWGQLLHKEISNVVPIDVSMRKPNKRYLWMDDMYMPVTIGEKIIVDCHFDTSASMDDDVLKECFSELAGIARAYKQQVEFRILAGDTDIMDDIFIPAGKGEAALKRIKLHGGGGTDHRPLFEYLEKKKNRKDIKLLICFTDACSSFPERTRIKTVFVLVGSYSKDSVPDWGKIIVL